MRAAWLIVAALGLAAARVDAAPGAAATPAVDVQVGVAAGGSAFLTRLRGPVAETTAQFTSMMFVRLRLPKISWRVAEAYAVLNHGVGAQVKSDDLRLGPVRLQVLDVGLFYALAQPITVQRLARRWDLTVGSSVEVDLPHRLVLSTDVRLFCPLDVFGVVTRNGVAARVAGEEIVKGAQLWGGVAYRW